MLPHAMLTKRGIVSWRTGEARRLIIGRATECTAGVTPIPRERRRIYITDGIRPPDGIIKSKKSSESNGKRICCEVSQQSKSGVEHETVHEIWSADT